MLTIEYAKDCIWDNEEHTAIRMIVKFVEIPEELPFLATSYDPMPYGVELFNNAVAGDYDSIAPYELPPLKIPVIDQPSTTGTTTI
jgi:hypothetical protein